MNTGINRNWNDVEVKRLSFFGVLTRCEKRRLFCVKIDKKQRRVENLCAVLIF